MLVDLIAHVRRRPAPVLALLGGGLAIGFLLALLTAGEQVSSARPTTVLVLDPTGHQRIAATPAVEGEDAGAPGAVATAPAPAPAAASEQAAMQRALVRGASTAQRYGGSAEAAVWLQGWSGPVIVGQASRSMRMWSMSKAVTAIAVMEASHGAPSDELKEALTGALTRSENCRQRRVIVGLQVFAGGADGARSAFDGVLERAGAHATLTGSPQGPESACVAYLNAHAGGVKDPLQAAYQYGTATWTVRDAVAFAYALGSGVYGDAGAWVMEDMALPKSASTEIQPGEYTAEADWGAGRALARWHPAYKAGWGGSDTGQFLAGQIAVVHVGGRRADVAAMYHPSQQPNGDDPGQVNAATAVQAIFGEVAAQLTRIEGAG